MLAATPADRMAVLARVSRGQVTPKTLLFPPHTPKVPPPPCNNYATQGGLWQIGQHLLGGQEGVLDQLCMPPPRPLPSDNPFRPIKP